MRQPLYLTHPSRADTLLYILWTWQTYVSVYSRGIACFIKTAVSTTYVLSLYPLYVYFRTFTKCISVAGNMHLFKTSNSDKSNFNFPNFHPNCSQSIYGRISVRCAFWVARNRNCNLHTASQAKLRSWWAQVRLIVPSCKATLMEILVSTPSDQWCEALDVSRR